MEPSSHCGTSHKLDIGRSTSVVVQQHSTLTHTVVPLLAVCMSRIVAFIHDEVIIELPLTANLTDEVKIIQQIMIESMEKVTFGIPVSCKVRIHRFIWKSNITLLNTAHCLLACPLSSDMGY